VNYKSNILIAAYRRPASLKILLDTDLIKNAHNLIIGIDGTDGTEEDLLLREKVLQTINDAHLKKSPEIYESVKKLGLYAGMRRNLDYAFNKYSEVTVLEEDCIPHKDTGDYIKWFRETISKEYENYHVCLSRHIPSRFDDFRKKRITKTKYPFVWGWNATSEVWHRSRGLVGEIAPERFLLKMRSYPHWNEKIEKFWLIMLQSCKDVEKARNNQSLEELDLSVGLRRWAYKSWATPYTLNYWMNSYEIAAIRPPVNLIENIGFGNDATHTIKKPPHALSSRSVNLNNVRFDIDSILDLDLTEDRIVFGVKR
jgi:hypothetical protein